MVFDENKINNKPFRESLKISLTYCLVSIIWIISSDSILFSIIRNDISDIKEIQIVKGIVFVFITTIMIFILVYRSLNKIRNLDMTIERKDNIINLKKLVLDETRSDLAKQQSLIDKVLSSSSLIVLILDKECRIVKANNYFYMYTGFTEEEIIDRSLDYFIKDEKNTDFCSLIDEVSSGNHITNLEVLVNSKDDNMKYMLLSVSPSKNKSGEIDEYVAVGMDVSENKHLKETINILNSFDSVTGLPKRHYLERKFKTIVENHNNNDNYAFLYIDIDNFSHVNEAIGHIAGDNLLVSISDIIQNVIGNRHMASRITNDNFAIVLENVECDDQIKNKVQRLQDLIRMPWEFEGERFFISSTIGISTMKRDGRDFNTLLKKASIAMEYCKRNNKAGYHFYHESIQNEVLNNVSMLSDIRKALINQNFAMNYQIVYDIKKDRIHGVESLIRWHHPTKGYISPMDFIPLAETTNIIYDIRDFVLDSVLKQKRKWKDMNIDIPKMGLNLSSKSFDSEDLIWLIESKLKQYNIKPTELVLEITESGFIQNLENIDKNIRKLRRMGIEIALDDFGTGYSSLSRLKELQLDYIKLDRTFIMNIDKDADVKAMVTSVIYLAQTLDLKIVAEGVETEGQLDLLRELGCNYGQGYYIHRPMSPTELERLIVE